MRFNRTGGGINLPMVTKNLLIINILLFIATIILQTRGVSLIKNLGVYYFDSPSFEPYQIITHMFMHGGIAHIFFNMFALFMFGSAIEQVIGAKRFFIFYFITGLGAVFLHSMVNMIQVYNIADAITLDVNNVGISSKEKLDALASIYYAPTVGASGAIFGLLLAFGMIFPNSELFIMFIPIPIKAKYFVIGYGLIEIVSGVANVGGDNIAHFAHVGGMLFGFILIKYWKIRRLN